MQNTNTPPIIQTPNSITVVFDNKPHSISREHVSFLKVRKAIAESDWDLAQKLIDVRSTIKNFVSGDCEIRNGTIYYQGEEVHNTVVDRIFKFMEEGMPWKPLLKFLSNLMANPSYNARKELYNFLENENLPVTEDGHFLAYKAVSDDYKDLWTGKIDNSVGTTVTMTRSRVDDNTNHGCSAGLHAGSIDYVESYGGQRGRKVIVKINPCDVVSVPSEDCRKLRCCSYTVISDFGSILQDSCYGENGEHVVTTRKSESGLAEADSHFDDGFNWDGSEFDMG